MVKFYLNSDLVEVSSITGEDTLLDFLRLDRGLFGTKEGCCEGDCGACTVLQGRVKAGKLEYKSVNACICLLPSVSGSHVVTVEGLSSLTTSLHPVQMAIVEHNGSQCGFCTPGIVMSLYDFWLKGSVPSINNIERTLQGNLCRCTGYGPIISAAKSINNYGISSSDEINRNKETMKNNLINLSTANKKFVTKDGSKFAIPGSVDLFSELFLRFPSATIVAGATDVALWITKGLSTFNTIIFIGNIEELQIVKETSKQIEVGACVTYSEFIPILLKYYPTAHDYLYRIAGEQIRNVGTVGGNIANGSPIGDLPPLLIALRAKLILRRGKEKREIPVEEFFVDYKIQNIKESEFIEKIYIPINENLNLYTYKVSKRRDEDISTVSAVFSFECSSRKVCGLRLAFGGLAATPKRATKTEAIIENKIFDNAILETAIMGLEEDFEPISDVRASKSYRIKLSQNLLTKCCIEYNEVTRLKLSKEI